VTSRTPPLPLPSSVKPRPISHRINNEAFYRAVVAAGRAPSADHTQPWRWQVRDGAMDLLPALDQTAEPQNRLATMACGAALYHARLTLAAQGCRVSVVRRPDPAEPNHLARLYIEGTAPVSPDTAAMADALALSPADPNPLTGGPIAPETLRAIGAVVEIPFVRFTVLRPDQTAALTVAASGGADREPGAATFAVLHGPGDQRLDWLYAGEALAAVSLTAATLGVSVSPAGAAIEHATTRAALRHAIPELGFPYVVLRLARHATEGVPRPLRRPTRTETVDLLSLVPN
jgi:nitroreductase